MGHKGGACEWRGVVAHVAATTCRAPASCSARAASARVAPVVTTSSTSTQVAPRTTPRQAAPTAIEPARLRARAPAVEVRLVGHPAGVHERRHHDQPAGWRPPPSVAAAPASLRREPRPRPRRRPRSLRRARAATGSSPRRRREARAVGHRHDEHLLPQRHPPPQGRVGDGRGQGRPEQQGQLVTQVAPALVLVGGDRQRAAAPSKRAPAQHRRHRARGRARARRPDAHARPSARPPGTGGTAGPRQPRGTPRSSTAAPARAPPPGRAAPPPRCTTTRSSPCPPRCPPQRTGCRVRTASCG